MTIPFSLSKASMNTSPADALHKYCERALRKLCGRTGLLPQSIYLSGSSVQRVSSAPSFGGGFADICKGEFRGESVALKSLRVYGPDNIRKVLKSFCKEAVVWRRLAHPNIASFLGAVNCDTLPLCMVSPWMKNGNMTTFVKVYPCSNRLVLVRIDICINLSPKQSFG